MPVALFITRGIRISCAPEHVDPRQRPFRAGARHLERIKPVVTGLEIGHPVSALNRPAGRRTRMTKVDLRMGDGSRRIAEASTPWWPVAVRIIVFRRRVGFFRRVPRNAPHRVGRGQFRPCAAMSFCQTSPFVRDLGEPDALQTPSRRSRGLRNTRCRSGRHRSIRFSGLAGFVGRWHRYSRCRWADRRGWIALPPCCGWIFSGAPAPRPKQGGLGFLSPADRTRH